jgi:hypothetical protein
MHTFNLLMQVKTIVKRSQVFLLGFQLIDFQIIYLPINDIKLN